MRLDDFCYFNRMIPRCIRTSAHTERPSASCVVLENPLEQEGAYNSNHNTVVRQAFYQPLLPSLVAAAGGTTSWSPPLCSSSTLPRHRIQRRWSRHQQSRLGLCAANLSPRRHGRALRVMGWEGFSAAAAWLPLLVSWETQGGRPAGREVVVRAVGLRRASV